MVNMNTCETVIPSTLPRRGGSPLPLCCTRNLSPPQLRRREPARLGSAGSRYFNERAFVLTGQS